MKKTCLDCKIEKDIEEFYVRRNRNSHDSYCKKCNLKRFNKWKEKNFFKTVINSRKSTDKHREKINIRLKEYRRKNKEKMSLADKKTKLKNPLRENSHYIVRKGLKTGEIIKKNCHVCGNPKSEAHHEDYSKPLEVKWFCHKHHLYLHRKELKV